MYKISLTLQVKLFQYDCATDVHRPEEPTACTGRGRDSSYVVRQRSRRQSQPVRGTQQDGSVPRQQDGRHRKELPRRILSVTM